MQRYRCGDVGLATPPRTGEDAPLIRLNAQLSVLADGVGQRKSMQHKSLTEVRPGGPPRDSPMSYLGVRGVLL